MFIIDVLLVLGLVLIQKHEWGINEDCERYNYLKNTSTTSIDVSSAFVGKLVAPSLKMSKLCLYFSDSCISRNPQLSYYRLYLHWHRPLENLHSRQITTRNVSIEKLILSVSGKIEHLLYGKNVPPQARSRLLKSGHHLGWMERRTFRLHINRMR
jgi:hypothetical protein